MSLWQTREVFFLGTTFGFVLLDMGHITIPTSTVNIDEVWSVLDLVILLSNSNAAPGSAAIYDLILIPVDEWAGDFSGSFDITPTYYLLVDSIGRPKTPIRSFSVLDSNDRFTAPYLTIASGVSIVQSNRTQRLWFVSTYIGGTDDNPAHFSMAHSLRVERQQQYWSMRGTG